MEDPDRFSQGCEVLSQVKHVVITKLAINWVGVYQNINPHKLLFMHIK